MGLASEADMEKHNGKSPQDSMTEPHDQPVVPLLALLKVLVCCSKHNRCQQTKSGVPCAKTFRMRNSQCWLLLQQTRVSANRSHPAQTHHLQDAWHAINLRQHQQQHHKQQNQVGLLTFLGGRPGPRLELPGVDLPFTAAAGVPPFLALATCTQCTSAMNHMMRW